MSESLSEEEIALLQQARRGAHTLGWLATFLLLVEGMYALIAQNLAGYLAKAGGVLVCLLTGWVCMLFLSGLSKRLTDLILQLFSPRHRLLAQTEKRKG